MRKFMIDELKKEVCKEDLLITMNKYIRFSIKYKIDIMSDNSDIGKMNIALIDMYNRYYNCNKNFDTDSVYDLIKSAEQLLAYRRLFRNV